MTGPRAGARSKAPTAPGVARPPASAPGCLLEEAGALDDDPGDLSRRHEPAGVGHRDPEREPSPVHGLEDRLRLHVAAHRGGGEVVELHAVADGRGAALEAVADGEDRGRLRQPDDAAGGEHRHAPALERGSGVVVGHDHLDDADESGLERHRRRVAARTESGRNRGGVVIDEAVLDRTLHTALRAGGDFAEVFAEDRRASSARLDDGKVEELTSGRERGAGIRVVRGETTGFAHTADLSESGLREAAAAAAATARGGEGTTNVVGLERRDVAPPHEVRVLPESVEKARKVQLLARADDAARAEGDAIRQVSASYADSRRRILVANSDGLLAGDDQVRTRFFVQAVAVADTGMQTGMEAPGRTVGFELFDDVDPEEVARTSARRALTMRRARPAPTGKLPVVLKKGAGGVLFHEACGHGLEADLVAKDASVFRGRSGEQVASPLVTLVDDGTLAREWGAYAIDDEGAPTRHNVLIQDGVLTDYMWDLIRARKEGREQSGNGRRETYQHLPMVRMTNTYLLAGESDPDEIVRQTPYGIYCAQLGGGQVNTATGDFVFGMTEAYLIENGEITEPVRAANLIGNGPETLRRVDAVGSDFGTWPGTCGKFGQGVPVSAGQPTLRVSELTIGGTAGE